MVREAPPDYESQLRSAVLGDPVVVVPADFETDLVRGEVPVLELVSDSANKQAESGTGRVQRLLQAFGRERASVSLALRGVGSDLLEPLEVQERDLASTQTRATQLTGMLPFFVLMAVLYGALSAALDTTAGERERGSLEPLLMNPTDPLALVLGKWGAVATVAMLIAVLSCFSFLPAQWLLRSDTLQALFQFGVREALMFLLVLLPFAAALSAVLMAVAIRCKSVKEAQANASLVVLLVSLLPLVNVFNLGGEARLAPVDARARPEHADDARAQGRGTEHGTVVRATVRLCCAGRRVASVRRGPLARCRSSLALRWPWGGGAGRRLRETSSPGTKSSRSHSHWAAGSAGTTARRWPCRIPTHRSTARQTHPSPPAPCRSANSCALPKLKLACASDVTSANPGKAGLPSTRLLLVSSRLNASTRDAAPALLLSNSVSRPSGARRASC